jgi:hypothetical protein
MLTLRFWPPDTPRSSSPPTTVSRTSESPRLSRIFTTASLMDASSPVALRSAANSNVSRTVSTGMCARSSADTNTALRRCSGSVTSTGRPMYLKLPRISSPERCRPASVRRNVLFPDPGTPINSVVWPGMNAPEMSCSAVKPLLSSTLWSIHSRQKLASAPRDCGGARPRCAGTRTVISRNDSTGTGEDEATNKDRADVLVRIHDSNPVLRDVCRLDDDLGAAESASIAGPSCPVANSSGSSGWSCSVFMNCGSKVGLRSISACSDSPVALELVRDGGPASELSSSPESEELRALRLGSDITVASGISSTARAPPGERC